MTTTLPPALTRPIPRTLDGALDPEWLSEILVPVSKGARVSRVGVVDPLQINQTIKSTIVRFRAHFEGGESIGLCLKGYLDRAEDRPTATAVRESRFYAELADKVSFRHPDPVAMPCDREAGHAIHYMRDMVEQGVHFCSALEPFDANRTAATLEQLARLHASYLALGPVEEMDWMGRQIDWLAQIMKPEMLQGLLHDERAAGIPEAQQDATRLIEGLKALSAVDARRRPFMIHGDCHAGNAFETKDGAGLIDYELLQRGGWALDVAYHIAATLPVDVAEKEERNLVNHYLETARSLGSEVPDNEEGWAQYRVSPVYGFFLWGITRTVKREIINTFSNRLSHSVARHDSYRLLGV
ncbi:phosphotransferase [Novosphingobium bradum]|uniref:Phosphotransferase n=1 Tax=Novosphingobium bradum TaxID=1737444 RepID=A0ABV7IQ32_9SPHN